MCTPVTEAEVREHENFLKSFRDNRTRCGRCDQEIKVLDAAHTLSCLHVLCSDQCLNANKIGDLYECPTCHLTVDEKGLEAWKPLGVDIIRRDVLLTCTYCVRNVPSIFWCAQCEDSLCQACNDGHPLIVRTAKHTVTLFDPNQILESKNDKVVCEEHNEKSIKYCVTCNKLLCSSPLCCPPHDTHELKVTKDYIKEFRTKVENGGQKMREFLDEADPLLNSINDQVQKILDPTANTEIKNIFREEMKRILDMMAQSEMLFRKRLTESCITKVKMLNLKRFTVKSLKSQVKQFLHAVGNTTGISNQNIAQNFRILNEHFEELEEGIESVAESDEEEDPGVIGYLPAFQQVSESLVTLIDVLSNEQSPKVTTPAPIALEMTTEDCPSGKKKSKSVTPSPKPMAGYSGNAKNRNINASRVTPKTKAKKTAARTPTPTLSSKTTPKVTIKAKVSRSDTNTNNKSEVDKVDMDVGIMSEPSDDESDGGIGIGKASKIKAAGGQGQAKDKDNDKDNEEPRMVTRARGAIASALPLKRSSRSRCTTRRSDIFVYETDRPHTRKREEETLPEKRQTDEKQTRTLVKSPVRPRSHTAVCARPQKVESVSPKTRLETEVKKSKEDKDVTNSTKNTKERISKSQGGESDTSRPSTRSTSTIGSRVRKRKMNRWSQGNDMSSKSHRKIKTAQAGTSTSTDSYNGIEMADMLEGSGDDTPQAPKLKRGTGRSRSTKKEDANGPLKLVPIAPRPGPSSDTESGKKSIKVRPKSSLRTRYPQFTTEEMKITMSSTSHDCDSKG